MSKIVARKRLVSREEYIQSVRNRSTLYTLAGGAGSLGLFCMLAPVLNAWSYFVGWNGQFNILPYFLWNAGLTGFGIAAILWARSAVKCAREMEAVTLITRHNTAYLPNVTTLVRGSAQPLPNQQTELLRAAGPATDTPPEQLLRATQEN